MKLLKTSTESENVDYVGEEPDFIIPMNYSTMGNSASISIIGLPTRTKKYVFQTENGKRISFHGLESEISLGKDEHFELEKGYLLLPFNKRVYIDSSLIKLKRSS
jgi:hypothetical protein